MNTPGVGATPHLALAGARANRFPDAKALCSLPFPRWQNMGRKRSRPSGTGERLAGQGGENALLSATEAGRSASTGSLSLITKGICNHNDIAFATKPRPRHHDAALFIYMLVVLSCLPMGKQTKTMGGSVMMSLRFLIVALTLVLVPASMTRAAEELKASDQDAKTMLEKAVKIPVPAHQLTTVSCPGGLPPCVCSAPGLFQCCNSDEKCGCINGSIPKCYH